MVEVKVKTGSHTEWKNGRAILYKPGDTLDVSDKVFKDFRFKFEKIASFNPEAPAPTTNPDETEETSPSPFPEETDDLGELDVPNVSVSKVLAAVRQGRIPAGEALAAEQTRPRPRESLIRALTGMVEGESDDD